MNIARTINKLLHTAQQLTRCTSLYQLPHRPYHDNYRSQLHEFVTCKLFRGIIQIRFTHLY